MFDAAGYPALVEDLATLEEEIEGKRRELSIRASKSKARFNRSQWIVVVGGVFLIGLTALTAALGDSPNLVLILTLVEVLLAFGLGAFSLLGRELGWQREWLDGRMASEQFKHEFYFYLGRVGEYGIADNPLRLLQRRLQLIEMELHEKSERR